MKKSAEAFRLKDFLIPMLSFNCYVRRIHDAYGLDDHLPVFALPNQIQNRLLTLALYNGFYTIGAAAGVGLLLYKGLESLIK